MDAARYTRLIEKLGTDGVDDLAQWFSERLRELGVTRASTGWTSVSIKWKGVWTAVSMR